MAFQAKYIGHCAADCGNPIQVGDLVTYEDDQIVHEGCLPKTERPRELCPRCFMEKPCFCEE
jgi:hypothetical protein